ncbi:NIPSNAP family protein [Oceanimonas sp. MB9]|uniref:NIPSNAP family protein n=1 Tax=Oceanimonas sp. MB9 TaxID=2588453 RepID=UPI0013F59685|nr:NIPSNAP family protein [Oceanimonas sp. MB9]NHI01918.1 hypothetical protein [Oceanimonas sp. MB9]
MKIVELREYRIKKGKTEQWLNWMRDELLPYQRSKGMVILDTYVHRGSDERDYFVWLREFDDEASRQRMHKETYNEWWVSEIRPRVFELIDEDAIKVRLLNRLDM